MLENIENAITRLPMDQVYRNLGGRIPSCSQYWKCYNFSYDGTDCMGRLLGGRVQASALLQNRFIGIWSFLLLTAQ